MIEADDGVPIGDVGLLGIHRAGRAELSIVIGEKPYWGRGYGARRDPHAAAASASSELDLRRVTLIADADNARGIACYARCGFRHEGVLRAHRLRYGKPLDMVAMAVLREEFAALEGDDERSRAAATARIDARPRAAQRRAGRSCSPPRASRTGCSNRDGPLVSRARPRRPRARRGRARATGRARTRRARRPRPPEPEPEVPTHAGVLARARAARRSTPGPGRGTTRRRLVRARRVGRAPHRARRAVAHASPRSPCTAIVAHVLGNAFSCAVFGTPAAAPLRARASARVLLLAVGRARQLARRGMAAAAHYESVGASTALFGAIGALAATELVRRQRLRRRFGRRSGCRSRPGSACSPCWARASGSDLTAHVIGPRVGRGARRARRVARAAPARAGARKLACGALALAAVALAWRSRLLGAAAG